MIPGPVVVLGGGGFIGSHLVARLVAEGAHVLAVDVAFPPEREPWLTGAICRQASMLDRSEALRAARGAGTVFHLAADMGGVGYFHGEADLAASMANGRMTLNVVGSCLRAEVERLVFTSSACVYPIERAGELFTEPDIGTGTPDQLYGAEKLHGLRIVDKAGGRVVVLDTVYGPGAEHDGPRSKMPAAVAGKALRARETGRLELWGDGEQLRRMLYVEDAVDRILAVAGAEHYGGPVNITGSTSHSCRHVAEVCLALIGADAEIVTGAGGPTGVQERAISGEKFEALYGPGADRPLGAGLGELLRWLDR